MAEVAGHLSVAERFRLAADARSARHVRAIWLLAKGHEVASTTAFGVRWVEKLLARYNAGGPDALGDLRRRNGTRPTILKPELLDRLRLRLAGPPADGGLWTSRKVAAWMAEELGLASVAVQRGWEALRVVGPGAAAGAGHGGRARGIQKKLATILAEEAEQHPGKIVEVLATDEPRIGLKPIVRRVWAPKGERPRAPGHHRFEWLYVIAFVQPTSGEVFGERGVEAVLRGPPRPRSRRRSRPDHHPRPRQRRLAHGAGADRPRGHPARPPAALRPRAPVGRMPLLDEPLANKHFRTIQDLDRAVAERCVTLHAAPDLYKGRVDFHWWPKPTASA